MSLTNLGAGGERPATDTPGRAIVWLTQQPAAFRDFGQERVAKLKDCRVKTTCLTLVPGIGVAPGLLLVCVLTHCIASSPIHTQECKHRVSVSATLWTLQAIAGDATVLQRIAVGLGLSRARLHPGQLGLSPPAI